MPKTTDHDYTIVASGPGGKTVTENGTLTLEPHATRAAVLDFLLRHLTAKHGPGLSLVNLYIKPDLR